MSLTRNAMLSRCPRPLQFLRSIVPVLLLAAVTAVSTGCGEGSGNSKRVNVLFPERDGLQSGDAVRYQGFEIGEVASLEPAPGNVIRVALDVEREHAENLREGAEFSIEEAPDAESEDERVVQLSMPKRGTPALPDSATVVGEGDRWENILENWQEQSGEMAEDVREELDPWIERIRQEVQERTGG